MGFEILKFGVVFLGIEFSCKVTVGTPIPGRLERNLTRYRKLGDIFEYNVQKFILNEVFLSAVYCDRHSSPAGF